MSALAEWTVEWIKEYAHAIAVVGMIPGIAVGLVTMIHTLFALRAKRRAILAIRRSARFDASVRHRLLVLASSALKTPKDDQEIRLLIEEHIRELNIRDQTAIEEGLHQPSAIGARRFAEELLSSAAEAA